MTTASGSRGASFDRVLRAIQLANGGGRTRQQAGGDVVVCCPAHGDTNPSCSVRYFPGENRTRVHCFVCENDKPVLEAARLTVEDLWDEPLSQAPKTSSPRRARGSNVRKLPARGAKPAPGVPPATKSDVPEPKLQRRKVCEYLYPDVAGNRLGKVERFDEVDEDGVKVDKSFRPMRFDPDARRWKTGAFPPVLYRAPEVAAAIAAGEPIYLPEGEKDADVAVELGSTGTTNAGGSKAFTPEHARQLAGAHVIAVIDRDLAGYERGVDLHDLLFNPAGPVASLRLVEPAAGKDLYNHHQDHGLGLEDLVDVPDPAAKAVAATPAAITKAIDKAATKGKPFPAAAVRHMLAKARTMLDRVIIQNDRPALEQLLNDTETSVTPAEEPASLDEARQKRQHTQTVDEALDGEPEHLIPTGSGTWAYTTGARDLARGVYRLTNDGWLQVAPLPYVLERISRRNGDGIRAGLSYRMAMRPLDVADEVILCSDKDVRDGVWAEQLDVPLAADDKIVKAAATAIRQLGQEAPEGELTPTWTRNEQLLMPRPDVIGGGYGELHGSEENARTVWRQIADITSRNPKVALVAGAVMGGLFVRPLLVPQRSVWVQLVGPAQQGKTTALRVGAALVGDPGRLIELWNTSSKGLGYRLSSLGCMPVFLDEMGASGDIGTARDRENLILTLMEGAQRRIATREQGSKNSASWHSTMVGSGNDSLVDGITNEAVYARVLEVDAPITETPEDSETLNRLVTGRDVETAPATGWPLHWLLQDLSVERFRQHIQEAEKQLPLSEAGGVARTMGRNLCLVIAGAAELDRVLNVDAFRPAATTCARRLLANLIGELAEAGLKPGDRVHAAIVQAITSRPHAFPTRQQYLDALADDDSSDGFKGAKPKRFLPRDVEGFTITGDRDTPGDIAILTQQLPDITAAAGITDPRPGLRELDKAGVLIRGTEKDGKRSRRLRIGHQKYRPPVYVFRLDQESLAAIDGTSGDTVPDVSTRQDSQDSDISGADILSPVSPPVPPAETTVGDSANKPATRPDTAARPLSGGDVPAVPGSVDMVTRAAHEQDEEAVTRETIFEDGPDGPMWLERQPDGTSRPLGPCRVCGKTSLFRDRAGVRHPACLADVLPESLQQLENNTAATETAPRALPLLGPRPVAPEGFDAACVVLDPTGLYLPDGTRHEALNIHDGHDVLAVGEKLNIGHPRGPGQVILTDAMCAELGLIAEAAPDVAGDDARDQVAEKLRALSDAFLGRARAEGWEVGPLAPEVRARRRAGAQTRVLDIVLSPYASLWTRGREEVTAFGAVDPTESLSQEQYAAEAARLMGHLAQLMGRPWRSSAVQAGFDLFDAAQRARQKRSSRSHILTMPGRLPALTGDTTAVDLMPDIHWSRWTAARPATPIEHEQIGAMTHAVHLDRIGAWLGSAGQANLGYLTEDDPEMRHHDGATAVAALLERPEAVSPGIYRLRLPTCTNPATPPLHAGQSTERPRWLWVTAPVASTLIRTDDPNANVLGWGCSLEELLTPSDDDPDKRAEAWTFPAHGRILGGLWYETLRDARYKLDTLEAAQHTKFPETGLLKHVYAGTLQSTQNTKKVEGKRSWHHQATWLSTVKGGHYSWQWSLTRRAQLNGQLVVAVEKDEIVILTTDPSSVALGTMSGKIGQYRHKIVRLLTDEHRNQIAAGASAYNLKGGELTS